MKLFISLFNRLVASSLFKASGIYTFTGIFNAAIPLLLLPILTTKLSPSDYGIVAMFQIIVGVIYPIIGMNLEGAISRKYYDEDGGDFPAYVGNCFILVFINILFTTTIYYFLLGYISDMTLIQEEWLKLAVVVAICQFLTTVLLTTYQIRIKPISYGIYLIIQSLVNIGLTLLFVVGFEYTWKGRINAQMYTGILSAILSIVILLRNKQLKIKINKRDIKHALNFGLPLIPHALGGLLFTAVDRFFLTSILGLEQTGNYSVAHQLGAIISLVTLAFNNAFTPWLYGELNKNCKIVKLKIVKFTYIYFVVISLFAIVIIAVFPFIVSFLIGNNFSSIDTYSTFIVWGFVFQGMYYMVTNYIGFVNKTYWLAIITISVGIIKIPITYFLIMTFGATGASISYCITFFLFFIATWILSANVYKMPWLFFLKYNKSQLN
jgi:O-antigen/teichoic acid export membrane protein